MPSDTGKSPTRTHTSRLFRPLDGTTTRSTSVPKSSINLSQCAIDLSPSSSMQRAASSYRIWALISPPTSCWRSSVYHAPSPTHSQPSSTSASTHGSEDESEDAGTQGCYVSLSEAMRYPSTILKPALAQVGPYEADTRAKHPLAPLLVREDTWLYFLQPNSSLSGDETDVAGCCWVPETSIGGTAPIEIMITTLQAKMAKLVTSTSPPNSLQFRIGKENISECKYMLLELDGLHEGDISKLMMLQRATGFRMWVWRDKRREACAAEQRLEACSVLKSLGWVER